MEKQSAKIDIPLRCLQLETLINSTRHRTYTATIGQRLLIDHPAIGGVYLIPG